MRSLSSDKRLGYHFIRDGVITIPYLWSMNKDPKKRRAYLRAWRWKKKPVRERKVRVDSRKVIVHLVKPVDPAMRPWITDAMLLDATNEANRLNSK